MRALRARHTRWFTLGTQIPSSLATSAGEASSRWIRVSTLRWPGGSRARAAHNSSVVPVHRPSLGPGRGGGELSQKLGVPPLKGPMPRGPASEQVPGGIHHRPAHVRHLQARRVRIEEPQVGGVDGVLGIGGTAHHGPGHTAERPMMALE